MQGKKTGGRQKGSLNRSTVKLYADQRSVAAILDSLNCNPIEGMVRIAMDEKQRPELRGRMFAELAQYRYPKLKSLELTGPAGAPIQIDVSPRELLLSRINSLATRLRADRDAEGAERPPS